MSDGPDGGAADLAHPLRDRIRYGEDLIALLIKQEMVIAEIRSAHVPMEILGLEIQSENIGQQRVERRCDLAARPFREICQCTWPRSLCVRAVPFSHHSIRALCLVLSPPLSAQLEHV